MRFEFWVLLLVFYRASGFLLPSLLKLWCFYLLAFSSSGPACSLVYTLVCKSWFTASGAVCGLREDGWRFSNCCHTRHGSKKRRGGECIILKSRGERDMDVQRWNEPWIVFDTFLLKRSQGTGTRGRRMERAGKGAGVSASTSEAWPIGHNKVSLWSTWTDI